MLKYIAIYIAVMVLAEFVGNLHPSLRPLVPGRFLAALAALLVAAAIDLSRRKRSDDD